jgi:hypothetical protein
MLQRGEFEPNFPQNGLCLTKNIVLRCNMNAIRLPSRSRSGLRPAP